MPVPSSSCRTAAESGRRSSFTRTCRTQPACLSSYEEPPRSCALPWDSPPTPHSRSCAGPMVPGRLRGPPLLRRSIRPLMLQTESLSRTWGRTPTGSLWKSFWKLLWTLGPVSSPSRAWPRSVLKNGPTRGDPLAAGVLPSPLWPRHRRRRRRTVISGLCRSSHPTAPTLLARGFQPRYRLPNRSRRLRASALRL